MDPKPEWHCRIGKVIRRGGATVRVLRPGLVTPSQEAIELVDGVLARLKSGESVAAAIVEVKPGGLVAQGWSGGPYHHELSSGAATLAWRLARG
jgi:hypothetical protein